MELQLPTTDDVIRERFPEIACQRGQKVTVARGASRRFDWLVCRNIEDFTHKDKQQDQQPVSQPVSQTNRKSASQTER